MLIFIVNLLLLWFTYQYYERSMNTHSYKATVTPYMYSTQEWEIMQENALTNLTTPLTTTSK